MYYGSLNSNKTEWRNSPRIDSRVMVDVVLRGRLLKENSQNISENGIFLKSKNTADYKIFDKLTLCFQAPGSKPIKKTGRVARKTTEGIGVAFLDNDSPNINMIPKDPPGFFIAS